MKPSNFISHPFGSELRNSESETVARNIMVILSRTGDKWRNLPYDEYRRHRLRDGDYSEKEKEYFQKVEMYCSSPERAKRFCRDWGK